MKFEKFKEILINIDPNGYGDHEVNGNIKISWSPSTLFNHDEIELEEQPGKFDLSFMINGNTYLWSNNIVHSQIQQDDSELIEAYKFFQDIIYAEYLSIKKVMDEF